MKYGSVDLPAGASYKINGVALAASDVGAVPTTGTPVLANGTTATTQSVGDNSTKVATTAFVLANSGGASNTARNNAGVTAWTSTTVAPTQAAVETALTDVGIRLVDRASAMVVEDHTKLVMASAIGAPSSTLKACWKFENNGNDSSINAHTLSLGGSASYSTTQKKFGSYALNLSGSSDYASTAGSADFNFGTSDFIIDFWIYLDSYAGNRNLVSCYTDGANYWGIVHFLSNGLGFDSIIANGSRINFYEAGNPSLAAGWYYIILRRAGTAFTLSRYTAAGVGGVVCSTTNSNAVYYNASTVFKIGGTGILAGGSFVGYVDEMRVVNGDSTLPSPIPPIAEWNFSQINDYRRSSVKTTDLVLLSGDQTIAGTKTFSSPIAGSVTGSAGSAAGIAANTNVNVSTGYSYQINSTKMLHLGTGSMTGNVFVGDGGAVLSHTSSQTGWYNVMVGLGGTAGSMTTGYYNVGLGSSIMGGLTTGSTNVAIGHWSMPYTNGDGNVAVGANTMSGAGVGYNNALVGCNAGMAVGAGFRNVCVGYAAGSTISTGSENICIGAEARTSTNADTNSIVIGSTMTGTGTNTVAIGNSSITAIKGQVGFTTYSDARLKNSIEDNPIGLDFIMALQPRRFKLNGHGPEAKMLDGFIAQEVMQTMTDLGVDFSGLNTPIVENDFYGITYDKFVVPLVNAVKTLKKELDDLKKSINTIS